MEILTKGFKWGFFDSKLYLWVECPASMKNTVQEFILGLADKEYRVEIKEHRKKRSQDANSFCWALINELSNVMRISKDECYLMMLKRYGQRQVIKVITEGLPILTRAVKYYDTLKEDGECTYLKIYTGSSEYDTREMAVFIDGIISECKDLGIETVPPDEILRIKAAWGKESK